MNINENLRFDGRVAVITGAGRGLGRSHALELASRGATVVINDFGGSHEGEGSSAGPANDVAQQIIANGGTALANTNDIGTEEGCHDLIDATVEEFGRVDIVINNAGISRWATFPEADSDNLERTLDVHVRGTWHTTRAAWPLMVEQGYGRIITTTSTGMFGLPANLAYATAKGALIGFTRSLAISAEPLGIRVNCLAPNAITRPSENLKKSDMGSASREQNDARLAAMDSSFVAPLAALLAHESCPVNGEVLVAGAKRYARWFQGITDGWISTSQASQALEDIAAHWDEINDTTDYYIPEDLPAWANRFMSHLGS